MRKERQFRVVVEAGRGEMGKRAAADGAGFLEQATRKDKKEVLALFAAAPSQDEMLDALATHSDRIDWSRVNAFQLDEYLDLEPNHPNTFKAYLGDRIFSRVPIPAGNVNFLKDAPTNAADPVAWYSELFADRMKQIRDREGLCVAFVGIGVNGHLAFNEPDTRIDAKEIYIRTQIDEISVQQQYDDYRHHPNPAARYPSLDAVPREAATITVSAILLADLVFCVAPGTEKAAAVHAVVDGPITPSVPASLLRMHHSVTLYLDSVSAAELLRPPNTVLAGLRA